MCIICSAPFLHATVLGCGQLHVLAKQAADTMSIINQPLPHTTSSFKAQAVRVHKGLRYCAVCVYDIYEGSKWKAMSQTSGIFPTPCIYISVDAPWHSLCVTVRGTANGLHRKTCTTVQQRKENKPTTLLLGRIRSLKHTTSRRYKKTRRNNETIQRRRLTR